MSALMNRLSGSSDERQIAMKCNLDSFGGKASPLLKDPWQLGGHKRREDHQEGSRGPVVQKSSVPMENRREGNKVAAIGMVIAANLL